MVTQEQTSKAKVRALAQGVKVWVLEPGKRYVCPSSSKVGTAYEVIVGSPDITCTCPGATHRGVCKHIGIVMVRLEVDRELPHTKPEGRPLEDLINELY